MSDDKPRLPLRRKILFSIVPLLAVLLVAEIALRVYRGELFANYREYRLTMTRRGYPATPHPTLGYVAKPNTEGDDNIWGTEVTIDADGFRSNGQPRPSGDPILTVGDSFTFGDEVDDDESWPAALERELERPVFNGGVFGYGFDQAVLRAELLFDEVRPKHIVVSLLGDDLARAELKRRHAEKPYFDLVGDGLELRNVPVPPTELRDDRFWQNLLGYSALLDSVLSKSSWKAWYYANDRFVRANPEGTGLEIGKRLIARLADRCSTAGCSLLLIVQGKTHSHGSDALLAFAAAEGIETLDLVAKLRHDEQEQPDLESRLFAGHMTAAGNEWTARYVAEHIREVGK